MEGGIDTEEQSSLEAAQDTAKQSSDAQEDGGEENKFQKAIGAWRSRKTRRINYIRKLMVRQTSTSPRSFHNSTRSHQTLSQTKETLLRKGKTSRRRRKTSGSLMTPASSTSSRRS